MFCSIHKHASQFTGDLTVCSSSGLAPYHKSVKEQGYDPKEVDALLHKDVAAMIAAGYNSRSKLNHELNIPLSV
jgi:hypothetical protein